MKIVRRLLACLAAAMLFAGSAWSVPITLSFDSVTAVGGSSSSSSRDGPNPGGACPGGRPPVTCVSSSSSMSSTAMT